MGSYQYDASGQNCCGRGEEVMEDEMTLAERWEKGIPHKPEVDKLVHLISKMDWKMNSGALDIKMGGDGDNGEDIMYILDELIDQGKLEIKLKLL